MTIPLMGKTGLSNEGLHPKFVHSLGNAKELCHFCSLRSQIKNKEDRKKGSKRRKNE